MEENRITKLNVAGSRESREPGIYLWVYDLVENAFFWGTKHPEMQGGTREG